MNKKELLTLLRKETATTLRVMRAFPVDQATFKPHERSNDALGLMKTFVFEMDLARAHVFDVELDKDRFKTYAPESVDQVITDFETQAKDAENRLESAEESLLSGDASFAGITFQKDAFLLMMICDQIHHRGQLSVYVRMAGGKVPSIYGPSADDESTNL